MTRGLFGQVLAGVLLLLFFRHVGGETEEFTVNVTSDNSGVTGLLAYWDKQTTHWSGPLEIASVDEPCDISGEEQLSVTYARRLIDIYSNFDESTKYKNKKETPQFVADHLIFFVHQTRFLVEFHKNKRIACKDTSVCVDKKCRQCDSTHKDGDWKMCHIQTALPFKFDEEMEAEELYSHRKFPNWSTVLGMTPAEFSALEAKGRGDLEESHYAVEVMLKKWAAMTTYASKDPTYACNASPQDQISLAVIDLLVNLPDAKKHVARNFFFYVASIVDFRLKERLIFCPQSTPFRQVCLEDFHPYSSRNCVNCTEVVSRRNLLQNVTTDEDKAIFDLHLACILRDPRDPKRKAFPSKIQAGNDSANSIAVDSFLRRGPSGGATNLVKLVAAIAAVFFYPAEMYGVN